MSRAPGKTRKRSASVAANPVLIGSVALLVVVIGVFLAYNANTGLPFVPTTELKVEVPNASRLVVGNDVREGGRRIGQVTEMEAVPLAGGKTGAVLTIQLDEGAGDVPVDSTAIIRSRSALGLKYLDLVRGRAAQTLPTGGTITAGAEALPVEFDDLFDTFDPATRRNVRTNLRTFSDGLSGRGTDLNLALGDLPGFLDALTPVMRTLGADDSGLREAIRGLGGTMALLSPASRDLAAGLADAGRVFEAFSRDTDALQESISQSPPTLDVARTTLPAIRPTLRRFAALSDDVRATAREVRAGAPAIASAFRTGERTLPTVRQSAQDLEGSLDALGDLAKEPTTDLGLSALGRTFDTLNPTLKWAGPHVTVCNYWNYWWTYLADNLSEEDGVTGTLQRVMIKNAPGSFQQFGAPRPTQATDADPVQMELFGDGADLHAQPYGRAVDEQGNADCESGQRGYPTKLAKGAPADLFGALDARTPGNQGPTFTGRPKVPEGQTFSAEPTGLAPDVTP